jgi:hypothetical protein
MSSERLRYLSARRGPESPVSFGEIHSLLGSLDREAISNILWIRAQHDDVLRRVLTAHVAIRLSAENFEIGRAAIDFALHFPDFIPHDAEGGYQQILDTIADEIDQLATSGHLHLALTLARHALQASKRATEKFAEGWVWNCAISRVVELVEKLEHT